MRKNKINDIIVVNIVVANIIAKLVVASYKHNYKQSNCYEAHYISSHLIYV